MLCYRLDKQGFEAIIRARPEIAEAHVADGRGATGRERRHPRFALGGGARTGNRDSRGRAARRIRSFFGLGLDGGELGCRARCAASSSSCRNRNTLSSAEGVASQMNGNRGKAASVASRLHSHLDQQQPLGVQELRRPREDRAYRVEAIIAACKCELRLVAVFGRQLLHRHRRRRTAGC